MVINFKDKNCVPIALTIVLLLICTCHLIWSICVSFYLPLGSWPWRWMD